MRCSLSHFFSAVIFSAYLTQRRVAVCIAMFRKEKSDVLGVETGMCVFMQQKFYTQNLVRKYARKNKMHKNSYKKTEWKESCRICLHYYS